MQYVIIPIVNETQRKLIQMILALEAEKSLKQGMPTSADWLATAANAFDKVHNWLPEPTRTNTPEHSAIMTRIPTDSEVTEAINGR